MSSCNWDALPSLPHSIFTSYGFMVPLRVVYFGRLATTNGNAILECTLRLETDSSTHPTSQHTVHLTGQNDKDVASAVTQFPGLLEAVAKDQNRPVEVRPSCRFCHSCSLFVLAFIVDG
jgi:hypothetical protein